jgi:hypothetical protein
LYKLELIENENISGVSVPIDVFVVLSVPALIAS